MRIKSISGWGLTSDLYVDSQSEWAERVDSPARNLDQTACSPLGIAAFAQVELDQTNALQKAQAEK